MIKLNLLLEPLVWGLIIIAIIRIDLSAYLLKLLIIH